MRGQLTIKRAASTWSAAAGRPSSRASPSSPRRRPRGTCRAPPAPATAPPRWRPCCPRPHQAVAWLVPSLQDWAAGVAGAQRVCWPEPPAPRPWWTKAPLSAGSASAGGAGAGAGAAAVGAGPRDGAATPAANTPAGQPWSSGVARPEWSGALGAPGRVAAVRRRDPRREDHAGRHGLSEQERPVQAPRVGELEACQPRCHGRRRQQREEAQPGDGGGCSSWCSPCRCHTCCGDCGAAGPR